jgi:hypothetical protein
MKVIPCKWLEKKMMPGKQKSTEVKNAFIEKSKMLEKRLGQTLQ